MYKPAKKSLVEHGSYFGSAVPACHCSVMEIVTIFPRCGLTIPTLLTNAMILKNLKALTNLNELARPLVRSDEMLKRSDRHALALLPDSDV